MLEWALSPLHQISGFFPESRSPCSIDRWISLGFHAGQYALGERESLIWRKLNRAPRKVFNSRTHIRHLRAIFPVFSTAFAENATREQGRQGRFRCGRSRRRLRAMVSPSDHGRISTTVPSSTAAEIWSISAFVTAMHPAVQSVTRCMRPSRPRPLRIPWIMISEPCETRS